MVLVGATVSVGRALAKPKPNYAPAGVGNFGDTPNGLVRHFEFVGATLIDEGEPLSLFASISLAQLCPLSQPHLGRSPQHF